MELTISPNIYCKWSSFQVFISHWFALCVCVCLFFFSFGKENSAHFYAIALNVFYPLSKQLVKNLFAALTKPSRPATGGNFSSFSFLNVAAAQKFFRSKMENKKKQKKIWCNWISCWHPVDQRRSYLRSSAYAPLCKWWYTSRSR